jgi:SH3-like domain-containing protein
MRRVSWLIMGLGLVMGLWGCASGGGAPVATAPRVEQPVMYYVSAMQLTLKSSPDPASADAGQVSLNDRVERLERKGSWFQVRTADGRQGWANDRDLSLRPVSDLYARRWGLRLKASASDAAKTLARLRTNDQVKVLETNNQGWARVTVARTQNTGWLALKDLSTEKVAVRRYRRAKTAAGKAGEEAAPEGAPAATGLGPSKAEAAPPPAKKAPSRPKTRPDMFEPF